ncbi:SusC/RagA family TonB-linked outer membrane protein [Mucilaginibacter sp. UYCu711]|uniref:SusC/RagA family TonB-linked outer membrane protein n=1 Tax=Mucilaginibacter sp. UYCu711 TaxID=3156339 RepID=UPI003D21A28A
MKRRSTNNGDKFSLFKCLPQIKIYLLLVIIQVIAFNSYAQAQINVTGKVTDEKGLPLPGVSVLLKGTTTGSITNANGDYTLSADTKGTLTFRYLGYDEQTITIDGRNVINIGLLASKAKDLDEVIVVAYGSQKKPLVTGAISTVSGKDLVKVSNNDLTNALTGRAPGVRIQQLSSEPGKFDTQIDIRGFSYIDPNPGSNVLQTQTGGPLFIIDGVQRDKSGFDRLDANEVESISVLKDATAAIYGVKAANGVILVTTKKGSASALSVNYTGQWGRQIITKYPSLDNAYEYATIWDEQQINGFISGNQQLIQPRFTAAQLEDFKTGKSKSTDFLSLVLKKTTEQQQQNITVNGGGDKVRYFLSGGYFNGGGLYNSGILGEKKYNFRSDIQAELAKGLTFGTNLSYINSNSNSTSEDTWSILKNIWRIDPTEKIYANDNPDYLAQFVSGLLHPIAETTQSFSGYNKNSDNYFTSTFDLTYKTPFLKGLTVKALFAYDKSYGLRKRFKKKFSQYDYLFTPAPANTPYYNANVQNNPSTLSEDFNQNVRIDEQFSINYDRSFGKNHINVLGLYEQIDRIFNSNTAQTQFIIDAVDQLAAGNRATDAINSGYSESANRSYVGKINYDYSGKYLAEFGFRYDGSSNFPPNSRWGFFPYGSLGWNISEESFIKNKFTFLDNLKLRATYGKSGDDQAAAFQFLTGYSYPSGGYQFGTGSTYTGGLGFINSPNPNITWYTSKTADLGINASFWKGLLTVEGDIFRRDRSGLLAFRNSTIPGTYGVNLPQVNLNSDRTQGYEIALGHNNRIGGFTYSINSNVSFSRTQNIYVEQNPSSSDNDYYRNSTQNRYNDIVWGYKYVSHFQNQADIYASPIQDGAGNRTLLPGDLKYADLNGDNIIDAKDQTVIGNAHQKPAMFFGTSIDAAWRGIDFSMLLQGATKFYVYYQEQLGRPLFNNGNGITEFNDRWHRENIFDPTSPWIPGRYPSTGDRGNYAVSSFWLRDASYLRIKSLAVGYTFPAKLTSKYHIAKARLFAQGYNIATWTKGLDFVDPEYADNRLYSYNYPTTLNLNFGVQLTF